MSAIDFADLYEQLLFGEVERAAALRQVVYDVTLKGATEAEVAARARRIETPKPLSVRVHNDSEEWRVLTPELRSGEATETARLIRTHLLGGATIPEHWYGQGGDVNRATAGEMGEPTFKVLSDDQRDLGALLADLGWYVVARRLIAYGRGGEANDPRWKVEVEFPELTAKDTGRHAGALAALTGALTAALGQGLVSRESAARLLATVAKPLGVELDPAAELEAARAEARPEARPGFREAGFDPAQPRDGDGLWRDTGKSPPRTRSGGYADGGTGGSACRRPFQTWPGPR